MHQTALDRTRPRRMTSFVAGRPPAVPDDASLDRIREAFREVHAARLHGFAMILTLGDSPRARSLAGKAIAAGATRHDELRHPERAAAWLRARVLRHHRARRQPTLGDERRAALMALGLSDPAIDALATLTPIERAALIAERIEGLAPLDVATVVDLHGRRLSRMLTRARMRYATAFSASGDALNVAGDGPLATRIRAIAARTMA